MIKSCIKDFDGSNYRETDLANLVENENVKLTGSVSVTKKTGKQKEFLSVTMAKKSGLVGATVFQESPLYEVLEQFAGSKIEGSIYGSIYTNGKYVNINIANVDYWVEDSVDPKEFTTSESEIYHELRSYMDCIDDGYLKQVVLGIYDNERIMKKFLMAPASEFSAYSYLGGLAKMTYDICFLADSMMQNNDVNAMLHMNYDIIMAAALLCNIGRAYMYDIDKDGKFSKNEYGIIDTDTSLTRDAVKQSMRVVSENVDDDGNVKFKPKNNDVIKELIHILDTSKSLIGFQTTTVPRTRNASIFASIINIVNSAGTFDKLENSNIANEKLVKAFEGGKYYFIPQE